MQAKNHFSVALLATAPAGLAQLYGVETGALTRAMKRNRERFPEDFCFQVTMDEFEILRCQTGILSQWG